MSKTTDFSKLSDSPEASKRRLVNIRSRRLAAFATIGFTGDKYFSRFVTAVSNLSDADIARIRAIFASVSSSNLLSEGTIDGEIIE